MDLKCKKTIVPLNNVDRGISEKVAVPSGSGCEENPKEKYNADSLHMDSSEAAVDGDLDPRIQVSYN